ncbi:MAG TPA: hypothetical protein VIJ93_09710 [bacterium]
MEKSPVLSNLFILTTVLVFTSHAWGATESKDEDKPFVPHWSWQAGINYGGQPSQGGAGQLNKELTFSGTDNLTQAGHFCSFGLIAGQQKVEGATSTYGALSVDGGLGLGFFMPSLSIATQHGASELHNTTATLTLGFQVLDPLTVSLILGGGTQSHQGPASAVDPTFPNPNLIVESDSYTWNSGIMMTFAALDTLSFSLTAQQETTTTFQVKALTQIRPYNQSDRIPSLTLGSDITLFKNCSLNLSIQAGQEFLLAGTTYSPVLGQTITLTSPTTQNFGGYSIGATYSFE